MTLWNRLPFFPPRDGSSVPRDHEKSQLSTYVPVISHAFHSNEKEDQNLPYYQYTTIGLWTCLIVMIIDALDLMGGMASKQERCEMGEIWGMTFIDRSFHEPSPCKRS